eukprot:TRINITY_DN50950_c0_g1_i1.p1 TRINITY_DN50950_c0_g1~~TRINITY_DN50950_c0_g1_i1.p1  ORF type:complete len:186 (-),score=49.07 TRINITY_DN50950_c0_g1_i1:123-680(-)
MCIRDRVSTQSTGDNEQAADATLLVGSRAMTGQTSSLADIERLATAHAKPRRNRHRRKEAQEQRQQEISLDAPLGQRMADLHARLDPSNRTTNPKATGPQHLAAPTFAGQKRKLIQGEEAEEVSRASKASKQQAERRNQMATAPNVKRGAVKRTYDCDFEIKTFEQIMAEKRQKKKLAGAASSTT